MARWRDLGDFWYYQARFWFEHAVKLKVIIMQFAASKTVLIYRLVPIELMSTTIVPCCKKQQGIISYIHLK